MEPSKSNNTETEEETTAFKRKRLRRVSFADNEITSVHIFRRDDDQSSSSSEAPLDPVLGLFRDLAGESDDEDDNRLRNPTDDGDHINSFLQPIGSPSPGGSSTTAAEDTDDDDFRGPVSADFIRPERLSDSGVSDDITMDSTAFSLHYRSIARSDSGDLKTPTRFGASASTGRSSGSPGSFMELTDPEKKEFQVPAAVVASGGGDSDDMSIEGEFPKSYNYGKLSPRLVAILAQGSEDLRSVSPSKVTRSPISNYMEGLPNLERSVMSPVQPITLVTTDAAASESSTRNTKEFDNDATVPARKQLDFAKTNKGTPPKMNEGDQLDLAAKYELDFSEGQVKESIFEDIGQVSNSNRKSDQVTGSPLHGFTPLSFSARKLVFMGSPDSPRCTGNTTPPLKQSGSFVPEVHVTPSEALSSIRKSILKLKALEKSPTSTLKEGVSSKLRTLETSLTATLIEGTGSKLRILENSPTSTLKDRINLRSKTLENSPTSILKEGIDKLKHRLSAYSPAASFFNEKDCDDKQIEILTSPLEDQPFSLAPGNNAHPGLINTDDHGIDSFRHISKLSQNEETMATKKVEERFNLISSDVSYIDENPKPVEIAASPLLNNHITRVVDFTLADRTVEKRKDEILADTHVKPFSSTVKPFDQNLLPSIECQSNSQGEMKQLDQNASVNSGLGQAIEYNTQTMANNLELSGFNGEQPSSSFEASEVDEFAKSASKGKPAESPSNRFLVSRSPIQEATTLLASLHVPPSELLHSNIQDLSHPGNSDGHVVDLDNNYHPVLQVAQSPLTKSGIGVSSGKKRKGVEIPRDEDNIDKIVRINRSPEVQKSGNGGLQLVLEQTGYMRSERDKPGDQKWNDWDHILKGFSTSTKQLHSPAVDKLNLRLIGMLENILVHLQKVEKWDILSSEICSQKLTDPLNIPRHKKGVEMRMLLFNIAYAKAKQQLLNIKHERLLKKVQQLSSGVQETQMMKNSMPYSSKSGSIDISVDDSHIHTRMFNSQGKCQVSCDKVMEKRQELEGLDQKAKSLGEFFFSYCKMEGDQSCTNIIKYVPDYLLKRMSYKSIFQNLKLWDVEGFERKDDYYIISLTYCGYIIQRFTVNAGLSSIIISNSLNDVTIRTTYPNMDAFTAFVFVLNTNTTKKSTGRTSMAQETQITSSLLSTLLDVTEEVQLALIEIRNLIQAKFYSPSVHQLYLQLSFIDFCSGKKVQVTLDMSCLKCGAYPVEVFPSQIYDPAASGEQTALLSPLVDEIRIATEKVRPGYSRIIRLCRCISQAVQACTQSR